MLIKTFSKENKSYPNCMDFPALCTVDSVAFCVASTLTTVLTSKFLFCQGQRVAGGLTARSNSRHFPMVTDCDLSRLKSQSSEGITPMGLILTTATNLTKITMSNRDHTMITICDANASGSHLWHDYNPPCCMQYSTLSIEFAIATQQHIACLQRTQFLAKSTASNRAYNGDSNSDKIQDAYTEQVMGVNTDWHPHLRQRSWGDQ